MQTLLPAPWQARAQQSRLDRLMQGYRLEQDRFGLNRLASIYTWRPKRESCSISQV
jgi:hypothetical protein